MRVLLANLTPEPQSVAVLGLVGDWLLRHLDEATVQQAAAQPEAFRATPGTRRTAAGRRLQLELPAYAIARLDRA